jgi:DNA-binding NarL/FixJ family response regulator
MSQAEQVERPAVVVASELAMVAEAVKAGLAASSFKATRMSWPAEVPVAEPPLPIVVAEVGLLVSDAGLWHQLRTAVRLIEGTHLPWVVWTTAPSGPMWGAMLEAGAHTVLPSTTGFTSVCTVLRNVVHGTAATSADERERLVALWQELLVRRRLIKQRVQSLTPREHEVLTMLHAGDPVGRIAQLLEVSPATVRSQVKAVRRKLQVKTQLGAVAELDVALGLEAFEQPELVELRA